MTAPGWYPDPSARHELRYFDGDRWTPHVCSRGYVSIDGGPAVAPYVPASDGMATAALVLGVVSVLTGASMVLFFIAFPVAILAFIFGLIGYRRSKSDPKHTGRGFSIAGVVLGVGGTALAVVGLLVVGSIFRDLDSQLGDAAFDGDWLITVGPVTDPAPLPTFRSAPGEHLVSVEVRATNREDEVAIRAPQRLYLEDEAGHFFDRCLCADTTGGLSAPAAGVAPGETITGLVWFTVTDGALPRVLLWQHDAFGLRVTQIELPGR